MGIGEVKRPARHAVFFDRDGVLNRAIVRNGKPYPPPDVSDFEILSDAPASVRLLQSRGFFLCVVTNQPDVARGSQSLGVVEAMHDILRQRLALSHFYTCYHDDADHCSCRKPQPGLLLKAAEDHGLSLEGSYMIGDRWRDIDCGAAAGCRTIFIDRGYSEALRALPTFRVPGLAEAAAIIAAEADSCFESRTTPQMEADHDSSHP